MNPFDFLSKLRPRPLVQTGTKIIDSFLYFQEIDLLKIRLAYLYDHVDQFVICEADHTFSGLKRTFEFPIHADWLQPYRDKINYIQYHVETDEGENDYKPNYFDETWEVEFKQRNFLKRGLGDFRDNDLFILCDVDEIWDPTILYSLKSQELNSHGIRLEMNNFFFSFNLKSKTKWKFPCAMRVKTARRNDLNYVRNKGRINHLSKFRTMNNAGWHFTYLGNWATVSKKLKAFSHQELNTAEINSEASIKKHIASGIPISETMENSDAICERVDLSIFPIELRKLILTRKDLLV